MLGYSGPRGSFNGSTYAATGALLVLGGVLLVSLYPSGSSSIRLDAQPGRPSRLRRDWIQREKLVADGSTDSKEATGKDADSSSSINGDDGPGNAKPKTWFSDMETVDWGGVTDRITDFLLPDWSKMLPGFVRKLQRELDSAPGSLADEIWREAHDPSVHPEIQFAATVRVSDDLCREEKAFRAQRKLVTAAALAKYLGLAEAEVNPDDVPVIALCGSGGGLRALVAGTGSLIAAEEAGLFGCVTYTAGVSGSCWLQTLYYASFTHQDFNRVAEHLRARLGVHIAYPPAALTLLTTAPTNKHLLGGTVERFKADPESKFGLVDIYGTLLAARLLVPRGELGVSALDFKLSNQRRHLTRGQNPMPIYTAVRHEIPGLDVVGAGTTEIKGDGKRDANATYELEAANPSEADKEQAKQKAWFQWFEITPYEFFCEEFGAGIPTWAMGRKFFGGQDVPLLPQTTNNGTTNDNDYRMPEVRMPLMMGIFGSAFCATLSHYYREIRPVVKSFSGMAGFDEMIWGRNDDLSKVHPIEPATLPNPVYGMDPAQLPNTVPPGVLKRQDIQLMDAGMSNNLPLYPFMRPGRGVEVAIVFDASADIRKDNWLNVADGYARQRGIKGWPIGVGWPPSDTKPENVAKELEDAAASTKQGTTPEDKLAQAKINQAEHQAAAGTNGGDSQKEDGKPKSEADNAKATARELGYCTVWVGSTSEKKTNADDVVDEANTEAGEGKAAASSGSTDDGDITLAPPINESSQWRLTAPDAGLTLVYLPYLANEAKVPGVDPATSEYMSTWNFIYTPDDIDKAVALAKANFGEGAEQIRATVRAVYERKKKLRLEAEAKAKGDRYRRMVRLGLNDKLAGDHFNH